MIFYEFIVLVNKKCDETSEVNIFQTILYSLTSLQVIDVPNRGGAEFLLSVELPVGAISKLTVSATAAHTELSICRIYVKSAGTNIPCVSHDVMETLTKYGSGGGNSAISLKLPSVANSGKSDSLNTKVLLSDNAVFQIYLIT